jgi:hypothetical protein
MTNEELNTALYEKMFAEQETYRAWLLSQTSEEILNHTYEYTVREDILMSLEYHNLPDRQARALLKSPSPLADVFADWENKETDYMDSIWQTVEERAKAEEQKHMGALYDHEQQVIFVRRGMDATDIFRSVSKELAHAEIAGMAKDYTREAAAFSAYSVSYMLCKEYGIDVSGYDFSRLPDDFRKNDAQGTRAALSEIRDAAGNISGRMNRALEQNRQPKSKEQER